MALVGPNGAGKTTLLHLAVGLASPTAGRIAVLDGLAAGSAPALERVGFVAQDAALYAGLTVADTLRLTRDLNPRWDEDWARRRMAELDIPLERKVGKLSGGQHAQVALAAVLAKRPELVVLDEPVARLDPLARHEFMAALMAAVAEDGLSVVFSSHVVSELERVCDYLIVLTAGQVQVAGEVDDLVAGHRLLIGPAAETQQRRRPLPGGPHEPCRASGSRAGARERAPARGAAPRLAGTTRGTRGTGPGLPARARRPRPAGTGRSRRRPLERGGIVSFATIDHEAPGRHGAAGHPGASPRPGVGFAGLARVTWRQHRLALVTVAALLAALSALLVAQGLGMHGVYRSFGLSFSHPPTTARGVSLAETFESEYLSYGLYVPRFLMFLPLFIGAFVGGPLVARELETGTFRFAWTQSAGRTRLTIAKLAMLGLALTAMALAFSQLFSWWYRPFTQLTGPAFEVEGLVFAARVLFGFALGAFAGAVLRRTVPAIATAMVLWAAVVLPDVLFLRAHFEAALTAPVNMTSKFSTEWTLSQWWVDPRGHRLSGAAYNALVRSLPTSDPQSWLAAHHYVLWETFQPASRFWAFQAIEASGLVVLSLALAGATVWWVRRKAS